MSKKTVLDVPVEFGGVSIGESTARLGIRIDRSVCNINAADEIFCGHRLSGRVIRGRSGDQAGQQTIAEDINHHIDAVFDVKRIGVNATHISTGLTFSLADVDIQELAKLSKGSGRMVINEVAELPVENRSDDDGSDEESDGSLKAEGPWAEVKLSELFKDSILKSLNAAKLFTVGDLANYTAKGFQQLSDIPGIGPGKAEKIERRMVQFWSDNPDADQQPETEQQAEEAAAS